MADNLGIKTGTDATVATEDVSGVHHQKVKMEYGGDGTATLVDTGTPLPVAGYSPLITVTPTLDTSAYSIGDIFFVATSVASAMRGNDRTGVLQTIYLIDKSDQAPAFDLYFFDANVAFGTLNAPPSISDADAASYMGHESIIASDWKDLGGVRVAQLKNLGKIIKPLSGAANIYVAGVIQTALTFTNGDLVFRFGFLDD